MVGEAGFRDFSSTLSTQEVPTIHRPMLELLFFVGVLVENRALFNPQEYPCLPCLLWGEGEGVRYIRSKLEVKVGPPVGAGDKFPVPFGERQGKLPLSLYREILIRAVPKVLIFEEPSSPNTNPGRLPPLPRGFLPFLRIVVINFRSKGESLGRRCFFPCPREQVLFL